MLAIAATMNPANRPIALTGTIKKAVEVSPKDGWYFSADWLERIRFIPSTEMIVDCLYFSLVTMATIGYGDIHPGTMIAKIATMAEILTSFGLIVVVLARVLGRSHGRPNDGET
jgi:hypothetical protein